MFLRRRVSAHSGEGQTGMGVARYQASFYGLRPNAGCVVSVLSEDQKCAVISALTEGVSIRATERLTGIHRDTIMRLGVKIGEGCAVLHGRLMVNLHCSRIELDEVWSFVKKKKRNVKAEDPDTVAMLHLTYPAAIPSILG